MGINHAFVSLLVFLSSGGAAIAQDIVFSATGSVASEAFGTSVASVGDLNGDGTADLAVGSPGRSGSRVTFLSGTDGALLYVINGVAGERLGAAVAGAGDYNNDGFADAIVGADQLLSGGPGRAIVLSGAPGGATLMQWSGDASNDRFGASVAGGADVNLDGFDDLVVGAPQFTASGYARVFAGGSGAVLTTVIGLAPLAQLGASVALVGDLNGDGAHDIFVGAPQNGPGTARVVTAAGSSLLQLTGAAAGDQFGTSVVGLSDVDGDGVPDLAVGARQVLLGSGYARVLSGVDGSLIRQLTDPTASWFGAALADAGDVDGDGRGDVAVGAPGVLSSAAASVGVWSASQGTVLYRRNSPTTGGTFATGLASADLDGNGIQELIVGDPAEAQSKGTVRVYKGQGRPFGVAFSPVGSASLTYNTDGSVTASNLGSSGMDGTLLQLGPVEGFVPVVDFAPPSLPLGAQMISNTFGTVNGVPDQVASKLTLDGVPGGVQVTPDFSAIGAPTYELRLFLDGALVYSQAGMSGSAGIAAASGKGKICCRVVLYSIPIGHAAAFQVAGGPSVIADAALFYHEGSTSTIDSLSGVSITAKGLNSFDVKGFQFAAFDPFFNHSVLGDALVEGVGVITNLGSSGEDGIQVEIGKSQSWQAVLEALDTASLPTGAELTATTLGSVAGIPGKVVVATHVKDIGDQLEVTFDFAGVGVSSHTVEVYSGGVKVDSQTGVTGAAAVFSNVGCIIDPIDTDPPCTPAVAIASPSSTTITLTGHAPTMGDTIRAFPDAGTASSVVDFFSSFCLKATNIPTFRITNEVVGKYATPPCQTDLGLGNGAVSLSVCGGDLSSGNPAVLTVSGASSSTTILMFLSVDPTVSGTGATTFLSHPQLQGGVLALLPIILPPLVLLTDVNGSLVLQVPGGLGTARVISQFVVPLGGSAYLVSNAVEMHLQN